MSEFPEKLRFHSPSPLVDIGANLTHSSFQKDMDALLERSYNAGVTSLILTGTDQASIEASIELLQRYKGKDHLPRLYATAGIHPHSASEWTAEAEQCVRHAIQESDVVASGECGLDFNRNYTPRDIQKKVFEAQLELAAENHMPLFLHERDAAPLMLDMLHSWRDDITNAVIHCFTGDKPTLHRYLDLDLYIGVTGWLCDERRGQTLREAVVDIPDNRLMIETDCPYLLPRDLPAKAPGRRNEPSFLPWICETLAALRGVNVQTLAKTTTESARRFFSL